MSDMKPMKDFIYTGEQRAAVKGELYSRLGCDDPPERCEYERLHFIDICIYRAVDHDQRVAAEQLAAAELDATKDTLRHIGNVLCTHTEILVGVLKLTVLDSPEKAVRMVLDYVNEVGAETDEEAAILDACEKKLSERVAAERTLVEFCRGIDESGDWDLQELLAALAAAKAAGIGIT